MSEIDRSKPVLVTGATGYVAGRLVERLLSAGLTVHAAVRDPDNQEKTKYLDVLAGSLPGSIRYFKADLLSKGSYDAGMEGCEVVFHTASPFIRVVKDPQRDLVDPACKGTINVLESANRSDSVKRVVLTSSCAAIFGDSIDTLSMPDQELTEHIWNTSSSLEHQPYSFSKTEAEKAAWKVAEAQERWQLVAINPSFVIGPGINPQANSESYTLVRQIGGGDFRMGGPELNIGCVDVRDVAEAHYQAAFRPDASGRYIVSAENCGFIQLAAYIKEKFPNYPIAPKKMPKWLLWLIGPMVGMSRKEVSRNIGHPWKANNSKSVKELGMHYRPVSTSITEFFQQLVDAGRLKKM